MASVTRKTFRSTGFLPTPAEIEAHTAEFKQRKLEEIANRPDPAEADRRIARERLRQKRKPDARSSTLWFFKNCSAKLRIQRRNG